MTRREEEQTACREEEEREEEEGVCQRRRCRNSKAKMIRRRRRPCRCELPSTSHFLPHLVSFTTLSIRSAAKTANPSPLSKETGPRRKMTGCKSKFCFFSLMLDMDEQDRDRNGGQRKKPACPRRNFITLAFSSLSSLSLSQTFFFFLLLRLFVFPCFCLFASSKSNENDLEKNLKKNSLEISPPHPHH